MRIWSQWRSWAAGVAVVGVSTWMALGVGLAAESKRGTAVTGGSAPALWVLAVGVSKYEDHKLDLHYADADAAAIAAALAEQKGKGYYRDVQTQVLLNDKVTRASVIHGIERFLGKASPSDIVVIFMAGHGTQIRNKYYFLPYSATQESVTTEGLGMSEFNGALDGLRENGVKSIVVMLDTCEAGALNPGARAINPPSKTTKEIAAEIAAAEGTFVLAASNSGESSTEDTKWKHGAFTFVTLEGLRGKADGNGDGQLYVNELFNYVDGEVRKLTDGRQHPTQDMKGTALLLASVHPVATPASGAPPLPDDSAPPASQASPDVIFVLPFEDLSSNPADRQAHEFTGRAIQTEFTNRLSKVKDKLRVRNSYSVVITDPQNPLPTLRSNGIGKAVGGSFRVSGKKIVLHAWIIDTLTGDQENLGDAEGLNDDEEIFRLETKLIQQSLSALNVDVSVTEAAAVQKETNNSLTNLNYLLQAEGGAAEASPPDDKKPTPVPEKPHAALDLPVGASWEWLRDHIVPPAYGEDDAQAEIKEVLAAYARAYQEKDLASLQKLYVTFPPSQAEALQAYLNNATDLVVELDDVNVEAQDSKASVSYTRRDHFTEKATGKQINLEVRLKKTFVHEDGKWKFGG